MIAYLNSAHTMSGWEWVIASILAYWATRGIVNAFEWAWDRYIGTDYSDDYDCENRTDTDCANDPCEPCVLGDRYAGGAS